MTIHKKGTKTRNKEKNEVATTSSSDVSTTETVEVVSSTSVVEESSQVMKSESRSSMMEVTSASREVIMDSKGNVIKVIETPPQTSVQRTSASRKTGKSSQDFIAAEQTQSIKQAKKTHETPRETAKSLSENRVLQGGTIEQSVQSQNASTSSTVQESVSSSTVVESSSTSREQSSTTVDDVTITGGDRPVPHTSSRSTESVRVSSETSEAITKDGQTTSNTTRIRETGDRIEDNGKTTATSSREVDNERTITPSSVTSIKIADDIKSGEKSARGESRSKVELSTRCNKPGQSTWDGTFVYEKPVKFPENRSDKTAGSKSDVSRQGSETSVKVTQKASTTSKETIDQIVSSSVTRDTKMTVDDGYVTTRIRDATSSEKVTSSEDATDFADEKYPRGSIRHSKLGDSAWDGSFVLEKSEPRPRRNDSDGVFRQQDSDNVVETTQRKDFKEKSTDGTYERESSETTRVVKGATDSTRFISEERHDVSRESTIHVDGTPIKEHPASPSHKRVARPGDSTWNGEFVYEKPRDDAKKQHPSDVTVVRRTEKRHDSVDIEDVTEDVSNVSESMSASYIVEYAISSDKKNVEKVTSVSEVILEEDGSDERIRRGTSESPEKQSPPRRDASSRCYKPGQSTWDGTFVYEQPKTTPDSRRKPEDRRMTRALDIRDVTEDKSMNEDVITSTSYVVEHSSSQQSFSDIKDASLTSTIYETVVHEGRPIETTIRFDKDTSRGRVSTTERQTSPSSPRPVSPEKTPRNFRSTKPGSSTWDGTFVAEKPQEKKRPPSRESVDGRLPDKSRPVDESGKISADTSKKRHEIADLRNVTRDSSSEITESSVVVEQSMTHESYKDSDNLDYSTTSVETVVIRDGQPITTQKTITIDEGSPVKRPSDVITVSKSAIKSPERKEPRGSDKSYRSTKPGSSTWDGTFVYEKPREQKPVDKKTPKDTSIYDKPSTLKAKPSDVTDRKTVVISETSKDVTSTADYSTSSVTVEQTFVVDSKTHDSLNLTKTIEESKEDKIRTIDYERPSLQQRPEDAGQPRDERPQKSPIDRSYRPTKPGASTWDGSFVYEKPVEKKPGDKKSPSKDTTVDKPSPLKEKPSDVTDHKTVVISETSKDVTSTADYSTSSVTVEQTFVTESKTHDSLNLTKAIEESKEDKISSIEYERPKPSPRQRPEDAGQPRDERPQKSPIDRSYRPTKPGASTWDGSFVYEKPVEKKPGDKKTPSKDTTVDKPSPLKEKPSDVTDRKTVVISETSKDVTNTADFSTSSVTVEQTFVTDTKTYDLSNISETFIDESTGDKVRAIEKPRQPSDEKPKPSPRQEIDSRKPKDERPQKSPVDRTHRPSKPGASTWDGSFVYEKPQDLRKKPTEPIEKSKEKPTTDKKTTQDDVTKVRYVEDVADITHEDITRTSEVVQQSSYVIDQSSSFTSVRDVRDITDERVITEFTTDTHKDVRDVTESTKEFIDKEQVTSMVARDVVDDTRFDTALRFPADSTRKPSPERPGYPRGILGLREDDRPKPIPAAGKPSRPPQRERSPQRPVEHGRPSEVRPKSPEKLRDYTSPTRKPQPAAGKPSRPEVPVAPRKHEEQPTKPAAGKPSRPTEKPEKSKGPDVKPKRGDQSPDSLDEDAVHPEPIPDILSKIPLKEQCICELCTCGRHRCPHNLPQEHLEFPEEPVHIVTSYRQDFDEKRVEKQQKYYHEDHLHTEGEFIGTRRSDYVATKGERAPVKKPQDSLKPEGEWIGRPREEAPKHGERAPVTIPQDNLKLAGSFDTTTTTELVFTGTPGERPTPIRRNTYTKIEGDFIDETTTRSQYIDHRSIQRAEIVKRTDNLTVGEGEFTGTSHMKEDFQTYVVERGPQRRPMYPEDADRFYSTTDITDNTTTTQDQYRTYIEKMLIGPEEKRTPIKPGPTLKLEGEFERPRPEEFKPAERRTPLKHPDNLRPEGEFVGRPKEERDVPLKGDRADVKKPTDNLRLEGDFVRPERVEGYRPAERPEVKKPEDNLRPEGEFVGRPKEDVPLKGYRADVKKPKDNLRPEGDFVRPERIESYRPAERPEVKRPVDNLRPEGDFERPKPEEFKPAERRTPIKHTDNLYPEGEFIGKPKEDVPLKGDRADVKKPKDNLRFEGDFVRPEREGYRPAERPDVKRPEDNLRPEGDFERPKPEEFKPAERRTPIKHTDNLYPEGEFIGKPKEDVPSRGDRADVKKPTDNLRPEGDFERPRPKEFKPAERRTPIKHADNLYPEGEFIGKPKEDVPLKGDRADMKKPKDNLRSEGDFVQPEREGYRPAERPEVKKPLDNLRPEGDFERPRPEEFKPAERRTPIKHTDNLYPEGEFIGKPKEDVPLKGDRADVRKPKDNLRPEGEFAKRTPSKKIEPAERRTPIKHEDNLQPEGDFYIVPKDDFSPKRGERSPVKKPQDNLRPEGKMEISPKDDYKHVNGERVVVRRHEDNLRMEGQLDIHRSRDDYKKITKVEKVDIKRYEDNIKMEGEFERPKPEEFQPAEKRSPIKHPDSLKMEGEFQRPEHEGYRPAERPQVKKPTDNLRPEGDFERPEKSRTPVGPAERRSPIKHPDNLYTEGDFVGRPKKDAPVKGERADVKKPKDTLRPEGEFAKRTPPKKVQPAERRTPIKHEDNLQPEGDLYIVPKDDFTPKRGERSPIKKPQDNLRPEGEMEISPKDDYKHVNGERVVVRRHEDNLRMEGKMDIHRSRDDYKKITRVEKVDIKKHEDTLKMEGEFIDVRRKDDYVHVVGERLPVIKHPDHLQSEGDFYIPQKTVVGPAEKRTPIKHPDNLKPEGEFVQRPKESAPTKGDRAVVRKPKDNIKLEGEFDLERPVKSPIGPAERRSPIKHPDNLHLEGEFVGRPKKDAPVKGERADVKKPKDTLRPEGEFAKRTLHTPKKVEPAERRTPIKHEDNLQPEGDFYIVPKDDFTPKRGDRVPVKKPQDNLRPEGEMEVSPKDDYKYVNGERVAVRRHEDNLRMEGQMDIHRSRDDYKKITRMEKVDIKKHEDSLKMEGEFIDVRRKDDYTHVARGERMPIKKHPDHLRPEGDFYRPQKTVVGPAEKRTPIKHPDHLKPEGDFVGRPRDDFTPKRVTRAEVVRREDNLKMTGDFEGTTSHKSTYTVVRGERADIKSHEDNLKLSSATMETKTTNRDTYTPSKQELSLAGKTVNRRKHMESSFTLGDDTTVMTTTNQRNYNTYTRRTGKDVAAKMSQMESDSRKTVESQTDGSVVTTVRRTTTSATQSDQKVANAQTHQQTQFVVDRRVTQPIDGPSSGLQPVDSQKLTSVISNQHHEQHKRTHSSEQHLRSQNVMQTRRSVEDRSITEGLHHRGQIVRGEETSRQVVESDEHRQHKQQHTERHHQEVSKRDYVNTQHMESRQRSATKQHEQHTISSQARYHSTSPEFRQMINGQTSTESSQVDSVANKSHHRKNVISSSSADISNAVLHRRGATTSTEALHTISSTAADQRKSISNLAESGQYISNSSQSSDRRSLTSLHRSSRDVNPWASSSYERPQRIVRQDNLTVGGKFYSQSEAKSYGNFSQSTQKVERVHRQTNVSHIDLSDGSTVTSSMYKKEYVPRHRGPCPAALLEAKQAPFKHTRDTRKHKFYMPVLTS
ncbi:titin isoform X3 [Pseudomyrmex gracilis]|uniref:titin isoform X3 n=1 Tax=Pseudomyrmex gracilis TaxID=219809 RepID=UPI000994A826|nr:titin isoform X3 [Pseudomyrmex gracilis]